MPIYMYNHKQRLLKKLQNNDYELDEKNKNAILTDVGIDKIEKLSIQKKVNIFFKSVEDMLEKNKKKKSFSLGNFEVLSC